MVEHATAPISVLDPYGALESIPLDFWLNCINDGKDYSYSFKEFDERYLQISRGCACSLIASRNSVGHASRSQFLRSLRVFYKFLEEVPEDVRPTHPADINCELLRQFAQWLKALSNLTLTGKAAIFNAFARCMRYWSGRPWASQNLNIPRGNFSRRDAGPKPAKPYSDEEFNLIVEAVKADLFCAADSLEKPYERKYLGLPPPLEGVAPYVGEIESQLKYRKWASEEYRIWWWENNCSYSILNQKQILRISGGRSFLKSLYFYYGIWIKKGDKLIGVDDLIQKFYLRIGAGKNYRPKYIGTPCPIKYSTPLQKPEYLHWYWENHCDCSVVDITQLKERYPEFVRALQEHHGIGVKEFFSRVGALRRIEVKDLVPYYLGLLLSTALNPSTIRTLEVDCLVQALESDDKYFIRWKKNRAKKEGLTIPISPMYGLSPIRIILRLLNVTKPFRNSGVTKLFISTGSNSGSTYGHAISKSSLGRALRAWFEKHQLHTVNSIGKNDAHLLGTATRFRPTIAQKEYVRTGQIGYVKALLSHSSEATTSQYIQGVGDPILRYRRGIHLDALFVGAIEGIDSAKSYLSDKGVKVGDERRSAVLRQVALFESSVGHCRNPEKSPIRGQKMGLMCSAHNMCLYCPNLVITENDLWRHFSFMAYHQYLLEIGSIDIEVFESITGEKAHIFRTQILPKYSPEVVAAAKLRSVSLPPPEWKIP